MKHFEKMVRLLVKKYGMDRVGAEKLVARSSQAILTIREQIQFDEAFRKYSEDMEPSKARIEALRRVVNTNGAWNAVADEVHKYQLSHRFIT